MAKRFRVLLTLDDEYAEMFSRIECKPRFVAAAVEFYLRVGESFEEMKSELQALREGLRDGAVTTQGKPGPEEAESDDLERRVDQLIEKTLLI